VLVDADGDGNFTAPNAFAGERAPDAGAGPEDARDAGLASTR